MKGLLPVFAGRRRALFLRLVANGSLQALAIVGSMLLVRHAFDVLLNPAFDDPEVHLYDMTDVGQIVLFAFGLLACTGLVALLRLIERIDAERLGQDYVHRVRMLLYDRMGQFAPRALSRRTTGAAALRFVGDLNALRRWVSLGLARIVVASIITLLSLGFLASIDPWLAAGCALLLGLGLVINLLLGPRMHRTVAEARRHRGRLAGSITERIGAFAVLQVFGQVGHERRLFSRRSRRLRSAMVDRARASGQMRLVTEGATAIAMGLVLSFGALEVFWGMTTSGNVVAAMAVLGFLMGSVRSLGRVHEYYQGARVSRAKLLDFLATPRLRGRSPTLPDLAVSEGEIELRNVRIRRSLRGVSARVAGGSRVALSGPNGAGKSTLLQVIARLVDPDRGRVLIDGQNIARCNLASVRRAIGIVSGDLPLLRGTVGYNLRYRWPDAPADEVARVRALCELDDGPGKLRRGEGHRLQEGGRNLSLGQRHRLMLARALLGNPALLLIDEVDANFDADAGAALDRVLAQFGGTVIMVSRATERIASADTVWWLERGRLIEPTKRPDDTVRKAATEGAS